ncbi:hypothetical protein [Burkholderia alba]|uniref:hypothetical protein n=1 Tax=Burkholderia alba TaxID=2683677 RepID=UPI002B05537A|nr:hypothetical protein [Burkholderia alba]
MSLPQEPINDLPHSVREIAEVIGREQALVLLGRLPRAYTREHPSGTPILYVPKTLKPDHVLVEIIGWGDASKLVKAFGGEILQPSACTSMVKAFRNATIRGMAARGLKRRLIAVQIGVSDSTVEKVLSVKPQEELAGA